MANNANNAGNADNVSSAGLYIPVKVVDLTMFTEARVHGGYMGTPDPQGIILHHDGAGPHGEAGTINWLTHWHPNPVSTNQYVTRNGTIYQLVPNREVAWHAGVSILNGRGGPDPEQDGTCNDWCIGIEIANAGDGVEPYTDAEYESVAQSVAYNCARYHIADQNVSSHARVALPLGRKDDPLGWNWLRMWDRIDQLLRAWPFGIPLWHGAGVRILSTTHAPGAPLDR